MSKPLQTGAFVAGGFGPDSDANEVIDVKPGSPAERAGIVLGDRIVCINGLRVRGNWLEM